MMIILYIEKLDPIAGHDPTFLGQAVADDIISVFFVFFSGVCVTDGDSSHHFSCDEVKDLQCLTTLFQRKLP